MRTATKQTLSHTIRPHQRKGPLFLASAAVSFAAVILFTSCSQRPAVEPFTENSRTRQGVQSTPETKSLKLFGDACTGSVSGAKASAPAGQIASILLYTEGKLDNNTRFLFHENRRADRYPSSTSDGFGMRITHESETFEFTLILRDRNACQDQTCNIVQDGVAKYLHASDQTYKLFFAGSRPVDLSEDAKKVGTGGKGLSNMIGKAGRGEGLIGLIAVGVGLVPPQLPPEDQAILEQQTRVFGCTKDELLRIENKSSSGSNGQQGG